MMLLLGLVDIFAAFALFSKIFGVVLPLGVMIGLPIVLFLKAFMFNIYDPGSIQDVIVALLIILTIFLTLPWWLLLIPALFTLVKGLFSVIRF